jgi:hypothetical protein
MFSAVSRSISASRRDKLPLVCASTRSSFRVRLAQGVDRGSAHDDDAEQLDDERAERLRSRWREDQKHDDPDNGERGEGCER